VAKYLESSKMANTRTNVDPDKRGRRNMLENRRLSVYQGIVNVRFRVSSHPVDAKHA